LHWRRSSHKTDQQLNGIQAFMSLENRTRARALLVVTALLGLGSTGCADLRRAASLDPGGVNPESPIAERAVAASRARLTSPRFSDIPAQPKNVRAASAFKGQVVQMVDARRGMNAQTAALPPAQTGTEAFATRYRDELTRKNLTAPPEDQAAQTEAYVAKLREMAGAPANPSTPTPSPAPAAAPAQPPKPPGN
jgi:hypothetical protein